MTQSRVDLSFSFLLLRLRVVAALLLLLPLKAIGTLDTVTFLLPHTATPTPTTATPAIRRPILRSVRSILMMQRGPRSGQRPPLALGPRVHRHGVHLRRDAHAGVAVVDLVDDPLEEAFADYGGGDVGSSGVRGHERRDEGDVVGGELSGGDSVWRIVVVVTTVVFVVIVVVVGFGGGFEDPRGGSIEPRFVLALMLMVVALSSSISSIIVVIIRVAIRLRR
mmetsp:Transcript_21301/g.45012  ORF Transcript_21301/g.45012 Transcript_21301/m.45012 type:complete len:222 (-) Transcript_21301:509-1174(-)